MMTCERQNTYKDYVRESQESGLFVEQAQNDIIPPRERIAFYAKRGTKRMILDFIRNNPGIWNNPGHFIRSAIVVYANEQHKKGRKTTR